MIKDNETCRPCKKPIYEYEQEMQKAYDTFRNSMGSYQLDTEFSLVKGYFEGYLAGMRKAIRHEDD